MVRDLILSCLLKILLKKLYRNITIYIFFLIYKKPKLLNKKSKDETDDEYTVNIEGIELNDNEFLEITNLIKLNNLLSIEKS